MMPRMVSSPRRRLAGILLLAAFAQPGASALDALVHAHIANDHAEALGHFHVDDFRHVDEGPRNPHEHSHFDEALPLASRTSQAAWLAALPSASNGAIVVSRPAWVVYDHPVTCTHGRRAGPLHPRAPPRA
jgi:hypothetical protein